MKNRKETKEKTSPHESLINWGKLKETKCVKQKKKMQIFNRLETNLLASCFFCLVFFYFSLDCNIPHLTKHNQNQSTMFQNVSRINNKHIKRIVHKISDLQFQQQYHQGIQLQWSQVFAATRVNIKQDANTF